MPRHEYLYGQTLPQLEALCNRLEMPRFAAKQIARWLYDKHATTIEAMSDLSARHRALLAETYEVGLTAPEKVSISTDGTKKYLYRTSQNHFIESAYIPDGDRATLCISSQAGCRMAAVSAQPDDRGSSTPFRRTKSSTRSGRCPNGNGSPTSFSWAWANRSTTRTRCCGRSR